MELRSSYGVRRLTRAHLAELGQGAGGEGTLPKREDWSPAAPATLGAIKRKKVVVTGHIGGNWRWAGSAHVR